MTTESPPIYNPPTDLDIPVWRYMDLAKFVSMLSTRSLYFCRTDKLGDIYEGTMSHRAVGTITDLLDGEGQDERDSRPELSRLRKAYRQWAYVNCWHMNENESAAMWSLYGKTDEAVAIRSTYRKLRNALPEHVNIGIVKYIDYRTAIIPEHDFDYTLVHKRLSFQHEREIRAVISELPYKGGGDPEANRKALLGENDNIGKVVSIDLEALVDRVYIAPNTLPWFVEAVTSLVSQYEFALDVCPSRLDESPVY